MTINESITGNLEAFKAKMKAGKATGEDLAELFGKGDLYRKSKNRKAMHESERTKRNKIADAYAKVLESTTNDLNDTVNHSLAHDTNNPAVFVTTYGNYNEGANVDGLSNNLNKWIDLTTFDDNEEFYAWLNSQASNKDAEWMFPDFMNFPESLYSESSVEDVFKYLKLISDGGQSPKIVDALLEYYNFDETENLIERDKIIVHSGVSSTADLAQEYVDDELIEPTQIALEHSFDYERYGRDRRMEYSPSLFDQPEDTTVYDYYGVDDDDDKGVGEAAVDMMGGIEHVDKKTLLNYTDFEKLGQYWFGNTTLIEYDGGLIEITE